MTMFRPSADMDNVDLIVILVILMSLLATRDSESEAFHSDLEERRKSFFSQRKHSLLDTNHICDGRVCVVKNTDNANGNVNTLIAPLQPNDNTKSATRLRWLVKW